MVRSTSNLFIVVAVLALCCARTYGQVPITEKYRQFNDKSYTEYIITCMNTIPTMSKTDLESMAFMTSLAISIDKVNGWGEQIEAEIRKQLLLSTKSLLYLTAMHSVILQSSDGVKGLLDKSLQNEYEWKLAVSMLNDNGYHQSSNYLLMLLNFCASSRGFPVVNVKNNIDVALSIFLHLDQDGQNMVIDVLKQRYKTDFAYRKELANQALDQYFQSATAAVDTPEQASLFTFASQLGKPLRIVSVESAQSFAFDGNTKCAKLLLNRLVAGSCDIDLLLRSARVFWRPLGDYQRADEVYCHALETANEPVRHNIRLEYYTFLKWLRDQNATGAFFTKISSIEQSTDLIESADALFVDNRTSEAATKYRAIMSDIDQPIALRVAAWAGMLKCDPDRALADLSIIKEVSKLEDEKRLEIVSWLGYEVWDMLNLVVPPSATQRDTVMLGWELNVCKIDSVKGWKEKVGPVMEGLLSADENACLRNVATREPQSLRLPLALAYCIWQKPNRAIEILRRSIQYTVPAPKEGWRDMFGDLEYDAYSPRIISIPAPFESDRLSLQLQEMLSRLPDTLQENLSINSDAIHSTLTKLFSSAQADERTALIQRVSALIKQRVTIIDPLPKSLRIDLPAPIPNIVDMKQFTVVIEAVQTVISEDKNVQYFPTLLRNGLLESMLATTNPNVQEALYQLTTTVLDRYFKYTNNKDLVRHEVEHFIRFLDARNVYNMKPFSERLKNKYP